MFSLFIALSISFWLAVLAVEAANDPEVYRAQKALKQLGYNPGALDGLWGGTTQRAIERFQRDKGLPVTGELDEKTKSALGIKPMTRDIATQGRLGEQRLALVIGNASYKVAPLRNPVNDARDIAATLQSLGFEVMHLENADNC
jgi:peptidoglycan hydrolase-like protein with peptidoglycan-binding domain